MYFKKNYAFATGSSTVHSHVYQFGAVEQAQGDAGVADAAADQHGRGAFPVKSVGMFGKKAFIGGDQSAFDAGDTPHTAVVMTAQCEGDAGILIDLHARAVRQKKDKRFVFCLLQ